MQDIAGYNGESDFSIGMRILRKLRHDVDFMGPGRRNDDAVDYSIACRVAYNKVEGCFDDACRYTELRLKTMRPIDFLYYRDCFNKVEPYLTEWGPNGSKREALRYLCRPLSYYMDDEEKGNPNE